MVDLNPVALSALSECSRVNDIENSPNSKADETIIGNIQRSKIFKVYGFTVMLFCHCFNGSRFCHCVLR